MIGRVGQAVRGLRKALYRRRYGTLVSVRCSERVAALTFDDGPHPQSTPAILELLERYDAKATFFLVGERAQRYGELVRRIEEAGHELANHTYDHPSLPLLTDEQIIAQIQRARAAIGPSASRWFRPPFGHQTFGTQRQVRKAGCRSVAWSNAAEDWGHDTAGQMADRVLKRLSPGDIVLMHDVLYQCDADPALADRSASLEALQAVLQAGHGYRFVTVSGLLEHGRPVYTNWQMPVNPAMLGRLVRTDGPAGGAGPG